MDNDKDRMKEARLARQAEQAIDGPKAMKEYRAKLDATIKNTAKLREQRLAREAAGQASDQLAGIKAKPAPKVAKPAPVAKSPKAKVVKSPAKSAKAKKAKKRP